MKESETKLEIRIKELETNLKLEINKEINKVELRIAETKSELIKWMITTVVAVSAVQGALIVALLKLLH